MIENGCSTAVSDAEYRTAKTLVEALEPVKLTTLAICQKDANLVTADAALDFLLNDLNQQSETNSFAAKIKQAIELRISERRNEEVVWLLKFLVNPDNLNNDDIISRRKPSKQSLISRANKISQRLLIKKDDEELSDGGIDSQSSAEQESQNMLSKKQMLQKSMQSALEESVERSLPKSLAQDIKLFEATH